MHSLSSRMRSLYLRTVLIKLQNFEEECECSLLKRETLMDTLLAHELFHAVEEQHAEEDLYTNRKGRTMEKTVFQSFHHCLSVGDCGYGICRHNLLELEGISVYAGCTSRIFL